MLISVVAALVAVALLFGGLGRHRGGVSVVGSTSVQPFAEMLAQSYEKAHADKPVDVQGGGSTAGLQALANGIADIGACSRDLNADEAKQFKPIVIARDGLAVIVNLKNPAAGLKLDQVRKIFAGEITNWKELGGADAAMRLIVREEGSGTREAFMHLVMGNTAVARSALAQESNGAVKALVKGDPSAIGYMSLGLVGQDVKPLQIDGVAPTSAVVLDGTYPLWRPFLFVVKGEAKPDARAFIDYVLSKEGQELLEKEGLVKAQ